MRSEKPGSSLKGLGRPVRTLILGDGKFGAKIKR